MATASKVLGTAAGQIGYRESGHNVTKFWADLKPSYQGGAWCAAFVQWCLKRNGMWFDAPLPYYVPSLVATAKMAGTWREVGHYTPKPGDLVVMGDPGRFQHIGFVEKPLVKKNQHIEGNTSSGITGSQNNGEGVYRRIRTEGWVRGFIVMKYDRPTRQLVTYPGHQHYAGGPNDRHVEQIQKRLNQLGAHLSVDGDFGPKTKAAVRVFQKRSRLRDDGFVGRQTWAALRIYNHA